MARQVIGSLWDRNNRNAMNSNFDELYEMKLLISEAVENIKKFENGIGNNHILDNAVSSSKLQGGSVTPDKTTFFDLSNNLFKGTYLNGMITHDFLTNTLMLRDNFDNYSGKTAVIPIEPNESYVVTVDGTSNILRVGTHSSNVGITDGTRLDYLQFTSSAGDGISSASVNTKGTDKYLYVYVSNEGKTPKMTVSKSVINKNYLPKTGTREIKPEHTTFVNVGENVFDGVYNNGLLVAMTDEGKLAPTANYESYKGKTAIVNVEPLQSYQIKIEPSLSNVVRVGSSSEMVEFGTYPTNNRLDNLLYSGTSTSSLKELEVTVPAGDRYLYIYVSNNGSEPDMTVERIYLDEGLIPRPTRIEPYQTTFFEDEFPNLFDGKYENGLVTYDRATGLMYFRRNYADYRGKTAIVPVEPNTTYSVKVHGKVTSDPFRIALNSTLPSPISVEEQDPSKALSTYVYEGYTLDKQHTFTTGSSSKYALIYVSNNGEEPLMKVEKGTQHTPINGKFIIPSKYLPDNIGGGSSEPVEVKKDERFNFPGELNAIYKSQEIIDFTFSTTADTMIQRLKDLVSINNDITSSELLTKDALGNDVYQFDIKPLDYKFTHETGSVAGDTGETIAVPKIIITGAVHGSERGVPNFLYYFMKTLLENPNNDSTVDSLRQNVHFIIVPLVNPSGFNANTYENSNNMNLNRDFPNYGSVTQKETEAIKRMIDENSDADFLLDAHNMFARDGLIGYSRTDDKALQSIATNVFRTLGTELQKEYSDFPQSRSHRWAFSGVANVGTVGKYAQDTVGIPSVLYEVPRGMPFEGYSNYDEKVTRYGVDLTMNLIYSVIRSKQ